jgi:hypothetical protein
VLNEAGLNRTRTPYQVQLACACGFRRPVVESHTACLLCRGAGQIRYKEPQSAVVQLGMTVMTHNAAALVRIRHKRLSKREQNYFAYFDPYFPYPLLISFAFRYSERAKPALW